MYETLIALLGFGGLPLLFFIMFLEGNPILGTFIPGQFLVLSLGVFIAATGLYPLPLIFMIIFLGSLAGDCFGYYMGRRLGVKNMHKFGLDETSFLYKSCCKFFKKFGIWSVFMGRQFYFTRAFTPFFAGLSKMNFFLFFFFAVLSCFFWTAISLVPGYYLGSIFVDTFTFVMSFFIFIILYFGSMYMIYRYLKKFYTGNYDFLRTYALHNTLFVILYFFFLLLMIIFYLKGYDYHLTQVLLSVASLPLFESFSFFTSKLFFIVSFEAFVISAFFLRDTKLIITFLWGSLFSFFFTLILSLFFNKWFGFAPYISYVVFVLLVFYLHILLKDKFSRKFSKVVDFTLIFLLICTGVGKAMVSGSVLLVMISFFIGAMACEIQLILSHYELIDKHLTSTHHRDSSLPNGDKLF